MAEVTEQLLTIFCSRCKELKEEDAFTPSQLSKRKRNLYGICRHCSRDTQCRSKYVIGIDEFELILSHQESKCYDCQTVFKSKKLIRFARMHPGNQRALLCPDCYTKADQSRRIVRRVMTTTTAAHKQLYNEEFDEEIE